MKRILIALIAPVCLFASLNEQPDVKGAEAVFETWMQGQIAYRGLPGVVVGVVHDQQLVWVKGFGYADLDSKTPMTPATKFRMASHSKLFTATAVMQLRDAGKIHLDDPVANYLPWFRVQPFDASDSAITIEELLTHSSGLPREAGAHWSEMSFPDAAGVRNFVERNQAAYTPEIRWKYSNLGFTIAGMVVEAVSGTAWGEYIQKHIFDPLGMTSSSIDRNVEGLATGYGIRTPDGKRKKMPFVDARAMGAATGITSTVEDMAKFVSFQFTDGRVAGQRVLSPGALRLMHRVRMMENNWQRGNAIGFAVSRENNKVYVGHGGSYFGYKTQTLMQMDPKVGVIVLANGDDAGPADIAMRLMNSVGEAVAKVSATPVKPATWDVTWSRFAGKYRGSMGETAVVETNQRFVMFDPSGPFPESPTQLIPIGNGQFRVESAGGGGPVGETVKFVERDGRVQRMYVGGSFYERIR